MKSEINEDILRTLLQALESVNKDGKSDNKLSITVIGKPNKKLVDNNLEDQLEESEEDESGMDMKEDDFGDMLPSMIEKMKAFKKKVKV